MKLYKDEDEIVMYGVLSNSIKPASKIIDMVNDNKIFYKAPVSVSNSDSISNRTDEIINKIKGRW